MKKIRIFFSVIILLSIIITSGCAPTQVIKEKSSLSSERLIKSLEANRRKINSFEGIGTLTVISNQLNTSTTFKVTLIKPDSISLLIMGPFGIELAQSLVTKEDFKFYDVLHNTLFVGATSEHVLRDIFRINLPFSDLMDAFIGAVNLTSHLYKEPNSYSVVDDVYNLTYHDALKDLTTNYTINMKQLGITDYKLSNANGDLILTGQYSEFKMIQNVAVPFDISVQNKKENQEVKIHYKKVTTNSNDISINFNIPDDAKILRW
ncbi:MAG: hypothetical protein COW08_10020 [Ignavibacteriales bacterium CG12_big_fil_rev_8_21_14_0_65_30_8]|nr:MAG: hypothetical protein COW08_10020 [Ignavibacteriales bacterium CG12_big_fil_rev_8_21_14_0_65_30_8]